MPSVLVLADEEPRPQSIGEAMAQSFEDREWEAKVSALVDSRLKDRGGPLQSEIKQVATKWVVGLIGVAAAAAVTGWWLYLEPKLIALLGGVPPGFVIASDNSDTCPTGWTEYTAGAGRTIIGAGLGNGLSKYDLHDKGGEETHTLTVEEMPRHTHKVTEMIADDNIDGVDSTTSHSGEHHNESRDTGEAGSGKPHNNMQPYIALTLCKKVSL
jgi:hypothetical protein